MKIVFIGYNYLPEYTSPQHWIERIIFSVIIMEALGKDNTVSYVGQIGYTGNYSSNGVDYYFLRAHKKSFFPTRLHSFVKKLNPDIVIVPGFHFPLQVIQLRMQLGKRVKIILEHHADKPFVGVKKILQKVAYKYIDAYNFTSLENAKEWLDAKIIRNKNKCFEIPATSSYFLRKNKQECRLKIGMTGEVNFLWVGRLDKNKDPLTMLDAFEKFLAENSSAQLHMIYQKEELLPQVKKTIQQSSLLQRSVFLHGKIPHKELAEWYSAADFFISASYNEGGSIALLEALSCRCIPIVTAIPSALKVIEQGKYGFYFIPGNSDSLLKQLEASNTIDKEKMSADVEEYFKETLSANAVAKQLTAICKKLIAE